MTLEDIRKQLDISLAGKVLSSYVRSGKYTHDLEKDVNCPSLIALPADSKVILHVIDPMISCIDLQYIDILGEGKTEEDALKDLIRKEDYITTMMLLKASKLRNRISIFKNSENLEVTKEDLEDLQHEVERWRLQVNNFILSSFSYDDLMHPPTIAYTENRKFTDEEFLDIKNGSFWGVNMIDMGLQLPIRIMFAATEGRYLGVRSIKNIDSFSSIETGYVIRVTESLCIVNPRAVACCIERRYTDVSVNYEELKEVRKKCKL